MVLVKNHDDDGGIRIQNHCIVKKNNAVTLTSKHVKCKDLVFLEWYDIKITILPWMPIIAHGY